MFCIVTVVRRGGGGGKFESADLEAAISNRNLKTSYGLIKSSALNIDVKLIWCYVNVRLRVLSRLRNHEVSARETFRCTSVLKICSAFSFGIVHFERHDQNVPHFILEKYSSMLEEPR
jgi:hypothetical protein